MHMPGQKRNDGGLRNECESVGGDRAEQRGLVTEGEKYGLARAGGLLQSSDHGPRRLRKLALGSHLGAELGKSLNRSQEPPDIVFLHRHAGWEQLPEQFEST